MFEYDSCVALIDLQDAQTLYRIQGKVSGMRLKLHALFQAPEVAMDLLNKLGGDTFVTDWTRSHANFFRAL
jgi:lipoprotein-releasing system permease protein